MKRGKNIWYYLSIGGILFSLGAIIYSIVTGETYVLGKFILLLGLSIYFFSRERKSKQVKEAAPEKEEEKPPGEPK